ncbi:hypothetical protein AX016_0377 [Cellulophaga sp. RHA19]|uniref:hypothetical protein n=1 Tax=Cellulophaga sp. RHA19 TaxID=1798237 RepID=UPI000C2B97A6|nr:hypothetical protein [Cellulophaga sp. RHA19]PKB42214.1 hypothetical protein AX016_0377 [Cellulophaga sp. RHA19]
MKKILILVCLLALSCSKSSPKPPTTPELLFPLKSSECTTGVTLGTTNTSEVELAWNASARTDLYEVKITNLNTNLTQTLSTTTTKQKVVLDKGVAYSWFVTAKNDEVSETTASEIWKFYNAGSQTTYPPFAAEIISPKSGQTVFKDTNNDVALEWLAEDVDNDIANYKVYFGTTTPPSGLLATNAPNNTTVKVGVVINTVYYWKVVTTDAEGNASDSGVYQFKAR